MKAAELGDNSGIYFIFCPGCDCHHTIFTRQRDDQGATYAFNRSLDRPTFWPEIRVNYGPTFQCHAKVTDGRIEYKPASTHRLRGQVVELPDLLSKPFY